jgi:Tol biopolymer transport system component
MLISHNPEGMPADGYSDYPMISADGKFVVFESTATSLVAGDTNGVADIFRVPIGASTSAAAAHVMQTKK